MITLLASRLLLGSALESTLLLGSALESNLFFGSALESNLHLGSALESNLLLGSARLSSRIMPPPSERPETQRVHLYNAGRGLEERISFRDRRNSDPQFTAQKWLRDLEDHEREVDSYFVLDRGSIHYITVL